MNKNVLINATFGFTLGLGTIASAIAFSGESAVAQMQDRFACDTTQMSTTVQTERGSIPLIRWVDRSFPPPFTPKQRCQIVSDRFRKFDNNGTLKYIKADTINNLPALCVAAYKGGSCLPNGLLVTFKPGTDANQTLLKILDRRVWASGGAIRLRGGIDNGDQESLISEVDGETYVNIEMFFKGNE